MKKTDRYDGYSDAVNGPSAERTEAEDAYEARKDALDRAIRFLIPDHAHRALKPDEVVATAKVFEAYLSRPAGTEA